MVETVVLCGRQGIALKGHADSGELKLEDPTLNDGNFRALLRYRAKTDAALKQHLERATKNATNVSPRIQNKLVAICQDIIFKKLVDRINKSKAFSILADETTDIAGVEQISICVRYLHQQDNGKFVSCEDFFQFVPTTDVTGQGLSLLILDFLETSGIDCTYLVGQGYDGARAMSGQFHGVQAYLC